METVKQEANKQFYKRLTANLFSADYVGSGSNVFRAKDLKEAVSKATSESNKLISINEFELQKDTITKLYEAAGLIKMLITFEDNYCLYSNIYHSNDGNYQFILEQLLEDYIEQLNSLNVLIKQLERIKQFWNLREDAVELFLHEYKERRKIEESSNENIKEVVTEEPLK